MGRPYLLRVIKPFLFVIGVAAFILGVIGWYPGRLFWDADMTRRSLDYHRRAESYAWIRMEMSSGSLEHLRIREDRDKWAMRLAAKYWRAERFPWIPLGPDEAPPDHVVQARLNVEPRPWPSDAPSLEPRLIDRFLWWLQ